MDIQSTNLRRDPLTATNSLEPDVQSAADLAAIAQTDEIGSKHSSGETSNVPKITDNAQPGIEPTDGRIYGQMTRPQPKATVGRAKQLMNCLSTAAREASSRLVGSIRQDPYSAALIGGGLAWLILQWWTRKNVSTRSFTRTSNGAQSPGRSVKGSISTRLRSATATSGSHIDGMAQHLADVAGTRLKNLSQQAQQLGSQTRGRAEELSGEIQETFRELGDAARDHVNDLRSNAQGQVNGLSHDVQGTFQRLTEGIEKALRQNLS